jgi:DNA-binding transcriptional MerR regulator
MLLQWTVGEVAKLIRVPERTVHAWISTGVIAPVLYGPCGRGNRLRLVAEDVLDLWIVAALRRQGVSLQRIRRIVGRLCTLRLSDYKAILVLGHDVIGLRDGLVFGEELMTGQIAVVDLEAARDRIREEPGEPLETAWELYHQAQEMISLV